MWDPSKDARARDTDEGVVKMWVVTEARDIDEVS